MNRRLLLSRRAAIVGPIALVACGASAGTASGDLHDPSSRQRLWAADMLGGSLHGLLVKRVQGPVPTREVEPFFRGWQTSDFYRWPGASRTAARTEIWENNVGDKLAVFRGVPQTDPRTGAWVDRGRTRAGVWELHHDALRDRLRMFVLPDGTWVAGWGTVSLRLSAHFAADASSPSPVEPKPGALFVQELTVVRPLYALPGAGSLHASDRIRGATIATYAMAGAGVPTSLDIVYPTPSLARDAAEDLARLRAASRDRGRGVTATFFDSAAITSEAEALVLRSTLPLTTLAQWTEQT